MKNKGRTFSFIKVRELKDVLIIFIVYQQGVTDLYTPVVTYRRRIQTHFKISNSIKVANDSLHRP